MHAGGIQVTASACDLHACVCSTNSAAADLRDPKVSNHSRLDRAAQGLFAGIDLSGGVLRPDKDAIGRGYGPNTSARDIVDGARVKMPPEARTFIASLGRNVGATSRNND